MTSQAARAKPYLSPGDTPPWHDLVSAPSSHEKRTMEQKIDAAAISPVESILEKRNLMARFLSLFSGRKEIFARQWADKSENKSGYVPVRRAMTLADAEEHLNGIKTYGIYLLDVDSKVTCGVIDADVVMAFRTGKVTADQKRLFHREKSYLISQIMENSRQLGISPLLEFSGNKGYHFWYFLNVPVDASRMKSFLTQIAEPVNRDISCFHLEVFPKQDQLKGKGFGNLVKLPLLSSLSLGADNVYTGLFRYCRQSRALPGGQSPERVWRSGTKIGI